MPPLLAAADKATTSAQLRPVIRRAFDVGSNALSQSLVDLEVPIERSSQANFGCLVWKSLLGGEDSNSDEAHPGRYLRMT